ncbi:MAG: ABC transporter substrate-binding protein [Oscillospiraceae bacterium]|nr:ABC transporter substrate-binding protein [Oscillospiraceae bacterium]
MNRYSKILSLVLVLALALSFAGCKSDAPADDTAAQDTSVTVTDMAGREVTLAAPAKKLVALTASDCEILYAIGAGDTLVGRGEYCDYPDEVLNVQAVQSGNETNIEEIIALAPDAVVMATMAQTEDQVKALEDAGIPVIVSDAQDIEGVYTAIAMLGAVTGKDAEAAALVSDMKTSFDKITADAAAAKTADKTVYFEVSPLEYGLWTAGSGTFMDEIAKMLGLTNAFADVNGWGQISEEQVIERDPDYIVTIAMYYGEGQTPVDEIASRDGWQGLKAVVNGDIFNADSNEISRPGPRLVDAAQALFDFVYNEQAAAA